MCVIVRTLLYKFEPDLIKGEKMYDYSEFGLGKITFTAQSFIRYLSCYGDIPGTRVCAINTDNFYNKDKWWILFGGDFIKIDNEPKVEVLEMKYV